MRPDADMMQLTATMYSIDRQCCHARHRHMSGARERKREREGERKRERERKEGLVERHRSKAQSNYHQTLGSARREMEIMTGKPIS